MGLYWGLYLGDHGDELLSMEVSIVMEVPLYRWLVDFMENPNRYLDDGSRGSPMT